MIKIVVCCIFLYLHISISLLGAFRMDTHKSLRTQRADIAAIWCRRVAGLLVWGFVGIIISQLWTGEFNGQYGPICISVGNQYNGLNDYIFISIPDVYLGWEFQHTLALKFRSSRHHEMKLQINNVECACCISLRTAVFEKIVRDAISQHLVYRASRGGLYCTSHIFRLKLEHTFGWRS